METANLTPATEAVVKGGLYGAIADVVVPPEPFEFGHSITLAPTKAHFMRPCLMTFERPETSFPSLKLARGSFGFDIVGEVKVPTDIKLLHWFDAPNTIWWLAALLRLRASPLVRVPILASTSFSKALKDASASFWPVETESERSRMIFEKSASRMLAIEDLEWVKARWIESGQLMHKSNEFSLAFQAFDQSSYTRDPKLALLLLWGGLEGLFSPSTAELRFRVSSNIATFLEPAGEGRALLQRKVAKLYDARSAAAHGRSEDATEPLIETYLILKRVLTRIVDNRKVPTLADLEAALFGSNVVKA